MLDAAQVATLTTCFIIFLLFLGFVSLVVYATIQVWSIFEEVKVENSRPRPTEMETCELSVKLPEDD